MSLHFNILTLFPEMFPGCLGQSLSGRALEQDIWSFNTIDIRGFGRGVHKAVDDSPYGGGAGMVMRADVIEQALSYAPNPGKKIYLSPRGKPLKQETVMDLAKSQNITLLCGRYEGVDQRVLDAHEFEDISVGDYVLSGGEPAALILMDACIRLLPGVMGNAQTAPEESFSPSRGGLLEYPHYTKPAAWTDKNGNAHEVPEILRSGNHAKIHEWREEQSVAITKKIRPDLLKDLLKK